MGLRITTWNIKWFGQLLQGKTRTVPRWSKTVKSQSGKALQKLQIKQIAEEIRRVNPDILCIQEGPATSNIGHLKKFCSDELDDDWVTIDRPSGDKFHVSGSQGIYFLIKASRIDALAPRLLSQNAWFEATEIESRVDVNIPGSGEHNKKWEIIHPLFKPSKPEEDDEDRVGDDDVQLNDAEHKHYRHPQVLTFTIGNKRVDLIGCHLKSKFGGDDYKTAGKLRSRDEKSLTDAEKNLILKVEQVAVENRIKLSTEASNIRYYVENRFRNEPDPAVFICGDLNDGVGKEVFERKYLFHDAISNLQGDVFFAHRFLNHALFDFPDEHRWSSTFSDVWDPYRPSEILLDHILFTQSVTGGSAIEKTGMRVTSNSGRVEHDIHNAVNAVFDKTEDHTSDHRPVSVDVSFAQDLS